jgi:hypothetical protein
MDFRLFISHSSPTPESQQRLRDLASQMEAVSPPGAAIRVLVDHQQIVGSDDWHRRIAFMLHVCHGGIVLLDDAALASKWVLAEATFLSLRQRAAEGFAFVPVSFLDEPDLEKARKRRADQRRMLSEAAWDVVGLPDVQYVSGQTPTEIAQAVVSALSAKGWLQPTVAPADRLADQLSPKFAEAGPQALRELADQMQDVSAYLRNDAVSLAALAIVRHTLGCGQLTSTRRQMDGLGTAFPNSRRAEILHELAPLPLAVEAAALLTRVRAGGG